MPAGVVHSASSSLGHGPERCEWPQMHVAARRRRAGGAPRRSRAGSRGAAPRRRGRARAGRARRALSAATAPRRPAPSAAARTGRRRRPSPASATHARADAPAPAESDGAVGALGERVHPRVQRREHGLVVVGRRAVPRAAGTTQRAIAPVARRSKVGDGGVQVRVVAVEGVHVVAQPHARVGDAAARAGAAASASALGERAGVVRLDALLEAEEARRLGLEAPVDPARDEPVVVVAAPSGRARRPAPARAPRSAQHGARPARRCRAGTVAQLERVAEDHEPVDAARPPPAAAPAAPGAAARSVPLQAPEVQVGDDEGAHGRDT